MSTNRIALCRRRGVLCSQAPHRTSHANSTSWSVAWPSKRTWVANEHHKRAPRIRAARISVV